MAKENMPECKALLSYFSSISSLEEVQVLLQSALIKNFEKRDNDKIYQNRT